MTNDYKVADKKNANRKPDVGGDEAQHTSTKPNLEFREEDLKRLSVAHGPPTPAAGKRAHAQGTSGKHAGRKELGW